MAKHLFAKLFAASVALASLGSCISRPPPRAFSEVTEPITSAGWIRFRPEARVEAGDVLSRYAPDLALSAGSEMQLMSQETDELGMTHLRYQQYHGGIEVEGAQFLVHARDGRALSANGRLELRFEPRMLRPSIDEDHAWAVVRERLGERSYYDGSRLVDALKVPPSLPRPPGMLLYAAVGPQGERVLNWRFDAFMDPVDQSRRLYVDATTGALTQDARLMADCFTTSAATTFRGTQTFNTARANIPGLGDRFILVDDCHGTELRQQSFNFTSGSSKEVFDSDNNWADQDKSLVTSFWALGIAYDFYDLVLHRKSYDNKNGKMVIVNHPTLGEQAKGGGGTITIGLGSKAGSNDDYNPVDIVGHEFTHSVIEKSAGLMNTESDADKESAALNESYSDIFGKMADAWDRRTPAPNWVIGGDKGCVNPAVCRNMLNPKAFGHPDTYKGVNWQSPGGTDPHVNGGVNNRWFALATTGGSGTNAEIGVPYNIAGMGIAKAQAIAYRTLTRYLVATSDYAAARDGSIQAAIDLYGAGSPEEGAVTQAWCAVGLCPFQVPTLPDRFDRPGGNPNPVSPNNNNSEAGATPILSLQWSLGRRPTLSISDLSLYGAGDVDNFRITLPQVPTLGGECFPSGVAFSFSAPVDARILVDGTTLQAAHDATYLKLNGTSGTFVLQVSAPFPSLILKYDIKAAYFQSVNPKCWQTQPPRVFEQIHNCPMCDVAVLDPLQEIILEADERRSDLVTPREHYFEFRGGDLSVPIDVLQGNGLQVELVDSAGHVLQHATWLPGSTAPFSIGARGLARGIYALRFAGFGNGTTLKVQSPSR